MWRKFSVVISFVHLWNFQCVLIFRKYVSRKLTSGAYIFVQSKRRLVGHALHIFPPQRQKFICGLWEIISYCEWARTKRWENVYLNGIDVFLRVVLAHEVAKLVFLLSFLRLTVYNKTYTNRRAVLEFYVRHRRGKNLEKIDNSVLWKIGTDKIAVFHFSAIHCLLVCFRHALRDLRKNSLFYEFCFFKWGYQDIFFWPLLPRNMAPKCLSLFGVFSIISLKLFFK